MHSDLIQAAIESNYDALYFHGTGLGHLPIHDPENDSPENIKLKLTIEDYCKSGGIAVLTTQSIHVGASRCIFMLQRSAKYW